jgi:hypothetical protein
MTLTIYGIVVLTFMMAMYAMEKRGPIFILAFALGCGLSSTYGFLSGTWPFGVVEAVWMLIALHRYRGTFHGNAMPPTQPQTPR